MRPRGRRGGLQWKIGDSFRLYGDYYYSPDSLSSGIDSYQKPTSAPAGPLCVRLASVPATVT